MRGSSSFDGKMHGNTQMVDRYNESKGKKPMHHLERGKMSGGESGGQHEPSGHDEVKAVVGEHGPAKSHVITKHEDGGGYHSRTVHEDGHVHHADHGSMEEAHEHGAHAFDDADHLGDMPRDDEHVAMEEDHLEAHPSHKTADVGYMK
jgi:hypothetical protein